MIKRGEIWLAELAYSRCCEPGYHRQRPSVDQGVVMHTSEALFDIHERAHRNLQDLFAHCRELRLEEMNRDLLGFGYPTVRLQLQHAIGAARRRR